MQKFTSRMEAGVMIEQLKKKLQKEVQMIHRQIEAFADEDKQLFATSSFQTQSVPMLHILSESSVHIPVYFLDTGYLFPETHLFKEQLEKMFNLHVVTLQSPLNKLMQMDKNQKFLYMTNPDLCCKINKNDPLEPILKGKDVWINGVRKSQSKVRAGFNRVESTKHGVLRYHPLLDWSTKEIYYYMKAHCLPEHPLQDKGYTSVGCIPCTSKIDDLDKLSRGGRWSGLKKEECGLHTEFTEEKSS